MKNKNIDWYRFINNILRVFIVISIIIFAIQGKYDKSTFLMVAFTLTFYDSFVRKILKMELNIPLKLSLLSLIFTAQCLGSAYNFYDMFHWWDTIVHGISGIIMFFLGMELINQLNTKLSKNDIHIVIKVIFSICFSLSIIVCWELFEFLADKYFGGNMQITKGLYGQDAIWDTIEDMLAATIGTIVATIMQVIRIKKLNK